MKPPSADLVESRGAGLRRSQWEALAELIKRHPGTSKNQVLRWLVDRHLDEVRTVLEAGGRLGA